MTIEKKKLVIFGTGNIAEMAYLYFSRDSSYIISAFTVTKEFIRHKYYFDLPVTPFEEILSDFPPDEYVLFIAIGESHLNRDRTRFYIQAKQKGYQLVSYISPYAYIDPAVEIGDNCLILENNVIQAFVKIKNNVTLWSGNHIGHGSIIQDNCFFASHIVIAGLSEIGKNCYIGINVSIANNVKIGDDCLIGLGSVISKNIRPNSIYKMEYARRHKLTAKQFFDVEEGDENGMD